MSKSVWKIILPNYSEFEYKDVYFYKNTKASIVLDTVTAISFLFYYISIIIMFEYFIISLMMYDTYIGIY